MEKNISETEFDILVGKYDRLKTTKSITNEIKKHYKKINNTTISNQFNYTKNYQTYKLKFNEYLSIRNYQINYNEKWLLNHYNVYFKNPKKSTVRKTKVFWFWIITVIILLVILIIILALEMSNVI